MDKRSRGRNLISIKKHNRAVILNILRQRGPISRAEIARISKLTPPTVSNLVSELAGSEFIREIGAGDSYRSGGRRPTLLTLNPEAGYVVGIKIGVTLLEAILTDLEGRILHRAQTGKVAGENPGAVVDQLAGLVQSLLNQSNLPRERLLGIGAASSGVINSEKGIVRRSSLLQWKDVPLAQLIEERFPVPVFIENDANVVALAEKWHGAAVNESNVICITIGVGIGAGIIIGGELYGGSHHGAGEIGHIVVDRQGPVCNCGKRGCLEALASDGAIARRAAMALAERNLPASAWAHAAQKGPGAPQSNAATSVEFTADDVSRAAEAGDPLAREIMEETGRYIGIGIANIANLIDPEMIILGGERMGQSGHLLLAAVKGAVNEHLFSQPAAGLRIMPSRLGNDAWVIGAATLVLKEFFQPATHRLEKHRLDTKVTPAAKSVL
ncbi:MAG: ROK family transcriptional regulator [Firmicutes bacterium]|nr:ROK family transcriptional regulator [Bacillota bacterium]